MKNKPAILVVEDDPTLNEAYMTILKTTYEQVHAAFNGEEALLATAEHDPDIILLDLRMPVMDGVAFLKKYQPKKNHPNVHIVVFSNYDKQAEVDRAFKLGAERYVLKSKVSPKALLKIVKDLS